MIIPGDTKKAVSVILSKFRPDGSSDDVEAKPEYEIDDHDADLKVIAEDMMRAFERKSAHDLMMAMKAFLSCIQAEDEEQDEGE